MSASTAIRPISRAVFSNLIDYAGLFPPAALSLAETFQNYSLYQKGDRAWIVGGLIVQASHLTNVATLLQENRLEPLSLSLVTKNPRGDLESAAASLSTLKNQASIKNIEIGLDAVRPLTEQLTEIQDSLVAFEATLGRPNVFFEIPSEEKFLSSSLDLLQHLQQTRQRTGSMMGYKLRCGGLPLGAPAPVMVGKVLKACAAREVPVKFTAGLHHPLPLAGVADAVHGFFNMFFAAFVANAFDASEDTLVAILSASPPSAPPPQFSDDLVSWCGFSLNASTIAELRTKRVLSFGSCSFMEPTDEAEKMGWLPAL